MRARSSTVAGSRTKQYDPYEGVLELDISQEATPDQPYYVGQITETPTNLATAMMTPQPKKALILANTEAAY